MNVAFCPVAASASLTAFSSASANTGANSSGWWVPPPRSEKKAVSTFVWMPLSASSVAFNWSVRFWTSRVALPHGVSSIAGAAGKARSLHLRRRERIPHPVAGVSGTFDDGLEDVLEVLVQALEVALDRFEVGRERLVYLGRRLDAAAARMWLMEMSPDVMSAHKATAILPIAMETGEHRVERTAPMVACQGVPIA